jgi:hypothetical protein
MLIPVCLRMYDALLMTAVTSRLQDKARKAGPSSILSLCCLKRDTHEFAPIVAVLTLFCLAMATNGCMIRVRWQAGFPSNANQAISSCLAPANCKLSLFAVSPMHFVYRMFQQQQSQTTSRSSVVQTKPMVCVAPNSIKVEFWFFLGFLDCCRKLL